jgi:ketosteroid isomerase-like protein
VASANLDLVRSIQEDWDRGDFSSIEWAHPNIEFEFVDGPDQGSWHGLAGMAEGWRIFQSAWEGLRPEASEFREIDAERVLVLIRFEGRAKVSGVQLGQMRSSNASVHHIKDGKVIKLQLYWNRDRALADLGLPPCSDRASP